MYFKNTLDKIELLEIFIEQDLKIMRDEEI